MSFLSLMIQSSMTKTEELDQTAQMCSLISHHCLQNAIKPGPEVIKLFFVLNSTEHEILNAHKYKNIKKFGLFNAQLSLECYFFRSYMLKCQQLLAF